MNRISKVGFTGLALIVTLAACAKSSDTSSTTTSSDSGTASPASAAGAMNGASANDGGKVYQTNCSSCHQATGEGIAGTFPPLGGNAVVTGDPTKVIHIVKYGLHGKIDAKGHSYNGMMPAWDKQISATDIASAVTFIRASWGNKASAVSEAQVNAVKQ
ncbi:MAG: cytochrome c [Candidatus Eremiobacteraeota bacterium]|nr:cytochrome c [Candidatus Eremiobacteraeota bacterium]